MCADTPLHGERNDRTKNLSEESEDGMNETQRDGGKGLVVAAAVGAAVGAGVALLFAPCSGRETRGWLARQSRDVKERTATVFARGKATARGVATEIGRDEESAASASERPARAEPIVSAPRR